MPFFSYNDNIPDAPNNPSNDQPKMKENFNSIDSIIDTDHYSFETNLDGYHKDIHIISRTGNPVVPVTIPRNGVLYTKEYVAPLATDTQLFYESATGIIAQLTGRFAGNNGWAWMGGMLVQWGFVSTNFASGSNTGTVTFASRAPNMIAFPNNCFVVLTTPLVSFTNLPSSQASVSIRSSSLSNLIFEYQFLSNSSDYKGFMWAAIGN